MRLAGTRGLMDRTTVGIWYHLTLLTIHSFSARALATYHNIDLL